MRQPTTTRLCSHAFLVLLASLALSGCGCEPEFIDLSVDLVLANEEVRTLPILASGKTSVAGVDIPDSHGMLEWDSSFSDSRIAAVDVRDLQFSISIDGNDLPIEIVKVEGLDGNRLVAGDRLRIWWTLDGNRVQPAELALSEGIEYRATVSFDWSVDTCEFLADGASVAENLDFIQPSIITTTFEQTSGSVSSIGGSAGYEAHAAIKNGIETDIQDVTGIAIGLGNVPGTVIWTTSAVTVNGAPVSNAGPGDDVVFSGDALPTTGSAPWLLILYIDHKNTNDPLPERDILAWLE